MTRQPDPTDAVTPDMPADVTPPAFTTFADIVEALTVARENRDWGQRRAAEAIGVTQQTLSAWEKRRVEPSVASLLKWANGLGVDLAAQPPGAVEAARWAGWADCAEAIAGYTHTVLGAPCAGARADSAPGQNSTSQIWPESGLAGTPDTPHNHPDHPDTTGA